MRVIVTAACAACVAFTACGASAAFADPLQIRIGWATTPTHMQPLIDELQKRHADVFPLFGKSYVAAGLRFQGSTPQIQALAINELEIAAFGPSALTLAVNNAHLDVAIVADVFQDGVPGYTSVHYVVRADSPIRQVEDLKGKSVASNAIGSFGDSAMRVMFRRHDISDRDVTTVETNFANMPAMLDDGKVELINLVPQYTYLLKQGKYRLLFSAVDGEGRIQAQIWAMRTDFIAAHRPALIDFFEDHIRAVQWLQAPEHHDEAVAIAAAVTKGAPDTLAFLYTSEDSYHAPDARPDIAGTQAAIDNDVKLGIIAKGLTVSPHYVDLSLVDEANARLKTH